MIYAVLTALAFYAILVTVSYLYMKSLARRSCDHVADLVGREVQLRITAGDVTDFEELLTQASVFVTSYRDETLKGLLPQQLWHCFMIAVCAFADREEFEREFRKNFGAASIQSVVSHLDVEARPELEEFRDVLQSVVSRLESEDGKV